MSVAACGSFLDKSMKFCKETTKNAFDACTTDKTKTLIAASVWNVAAAGFVAHSALETQHYNRVEWWSDFALHLLNAGTCATLAIIPSNVPTPIQKMLDTATSATIFANKARLAAIAASVAYGTNTIPAIPEAVDVGNHGLMLAILEKYGTTSHAS